MYIRRAEIKHPEGLYAQSASKFVHTAMKYQSEIYIINEDEQINAKSILGLLASALNFGTKVALRAEGPDEKEAVNTLCTIIESCT